MSLTVTEYKYAYKTFSNTKTENKVDSRSDISYYRGKKNNTIYVEGSDKDTEKDVACGKQPCDVRLLKGKHSISLALLLRLVPGFHPFFWCHLSVCFPPPASPCLTSNSRPG